MQPYRNRSLEALEPRTLLAGNGLAAAYFDNDNFTGKSVSRIDATVNFDWKTAAPVSGIAADSFSARWGGQILAPGTEQFTFHTTSDDGVRLWVDGKLIINNWTEHAPKEDIGLVNLVGGKRYNFKLEYFDKAQGAVMKLAWSSKTTAKSVIPQSQLFSSATIPSASPSTVTPAPTSAPNGNGNGLFATYFDNDNFSGKTITRADKTVDFNFNTGSPDTSIAADTFSARWTGQVLAQHTQEYTFYTTSDDGVRLWVNGQLIINNWTDHAPKEDLGRIRLEAGKKYDIKLEYFEKLHGATIALRWSGAKTPKAIVPQTQLFSTVPVPAPTPTPVPAPIPAPAPAPAPIPSNTNGLLGAYYANTDFTGSSVTRYDKQVAFDWGTSSPHEVIGSEQWAARWLGQVLAPKTEEYTFHLTTDGAARMWVNGVQLVNAWTPHARREDFGKIRLEAGKKYDIRIEYIDDSGQAVTQLRWSSPSIAKQFIPSANLFAATPEPIRLTVPPTSVFTGYKTFLNSQFSVRPGSPADKELVLDGYRISNLPIDVKGMNIAVTDLVPGQLAWAYRNITIRNTEISDLYRSPGYHNDFIRIAGAAKRQDVPINILLENIHLHTGTAIPILITDGDYDTIVVRNVKITDTSVNQLQINTQRVGTVQRVIVENSPGLSVALIGLPGTIKEVIVRNSPGAKVADSLNYLKTKSGVKITVMP